VGKYNLLGKKEPDLDLPQGLMMYFPQEGCSQFCPKKAVHFLPQESKKKISRLFSEFE